MLLVAAELMLRVAPTTIFSLFFWHFLPSRIYGHMLTTKGYILGVGVLCVADNVNSDSHSLSAERCLKFGRILCLDKSAVFLLTD